MNVLRFLPHPIWPLTLTEQDIGNLLSPLGGMYLTYDYFIVPVRLIVGSEDMFGVRLGDQQRQNLKVEELPFGFQPMNLAHIAIGGLATLRDARIDGVATYDIPLDGGLKLTHRDGMIAITSSVTQRTGESSFLELEREWIEFGQEVAQFLANLVPRLRQHPDYGAWFRGEQSDPLLRPT